MVKVKICGVTNEEDALSACECGADLLGFVFVNNTPRFVDETTVKQIVCGRLKQINPDIVLVGLFKDEDLEIAARNISNCGLDSVQLHGNESPEYCRELKDLVAEKNGKFVTIIKSFKVGSIILPNAAYETKDYENVDYFVFDTFHPEIAGGTGTKFDWEILRNEKENIQKPFFIAGGLNAENVSEVVRKVHPYGVDVSGGVEKSPGKKDKNLLKEFISNAKNA